MLMSLFVSIKDRTTKPAEEEQEHVGDTVMMMMLLLSIFLQNL